MRLAAPLLDGDVMRVYQLSTFLSFLPNTKSLLSHLINNKSAVVCRRCGFARYRQERKKRRLAAAIAFFVRKEKENACFPPLHISCAKRADRCCSISARIVLTSASVEGVWGGSNGLLQLSAFLNASWGVAHVRKVRVKLPQTEQKQLLFSPPRNSFFFPLSI